MSATANNVRNRVKSSSRFILLFCRYFLDRSACEDQLIFSQTTQIRHAAVNRPRKKVPLSVRQHDAPTCNKPVDVPNLTFYSFPERGPSHFLSPRAGAHSNGLHARRPCRPGRCASRRGPRFMPWRGPCICFHCSNCSGVRMPFIFSACALRYARICSA